MGTQAPLPPGSPGAPLFYTFPMPKTAQQVVAARSKRPDPQTRHKSFDYDFAAGDFRAGADGKVQIADGPLALVQKAVKIVLTERYAYRAYTRYFGTEIDAALKQRFRAQSQTDLQVTISQALRWSIANIDVSNFVFQWQGDDLHLSFDIEDKQVIGSRQRISVHL